MSADFGGSRKAGFGQHSDHRHTPLGNERARAFAVAVAEITTAAGRPIRYTQIVPDAFADEMRQAGVPDDFIAPAGRALPGRARRTQEPCYARRQRGARTSARDFSDYAPATAASGAWGL